MDELKLKLSTKFMRGIVTKLLAKIIYSKYGYRVDIQLNNIELVSKDGMVHLHADVEADVNNDDFKKIIKSVGLD